ncbi:TATA-box-binding protein [Plasmodium brasilianum]|uniref:TATA-box-binding protein n=2 Tax=Plasmodium (Plasmodium) TaxID=418103 RepID=A0ACB9YC13_PLABR|nr:TATA-box-binding protein, putative [Plasmodium malariae]KAI4839757.1 TATA-box-binding protein [Plasmodium brasilianum]SBS96746.1 TATA-box binding protein, putative (TBP) [Plasmodium malariae]SBT86700.1 TATA-box-binding protein, putative [Plasmodium malariae]
MNEEDYEISSAHFLLRDDEANGKGMSINRSGNDNNGEDYYNGNEHGHISLGEKYEKENGTNFNSDNEVDMNSEGVKSKLDHRNVVLNIHNIIASANLCVDIDLRLIAVSIRNAEYNPSKINTLIIRLNKPKCTALIFKNGRIMLTGTKTKKDSIYGCKKIGKIIKMVTNDCVKFKNFKIENIIASANCNIPIRLEMLAHDHKEYCNYEPELFAGLVYRYKPTSKLKSVILIFVSGKIIITGCKSVQKLNIVFQDIYNVLVQYKS